MSWGVSVTQKAPGELSDALDANFNQFYPDPHDEVKEQFQAAKEATDRLLDVVNGEYFNCSMGGHSQNAMPGSSPDAINVSLSATTAPVQVVE